MYSKLIREIEIEAAKCARCGSCQGVCPIFQLTRREQEVARGKIALADAFLRGDIGKTRHLREIIENCLVCLACKDNCPNNVDTELVIRNLRILLKKSGSVLSTGEIFGQVLKSPSLLRKALKLERSLSPAFLQNIVPESSGVRIRYPFSLLFEVRFLPDRAPLRNSIPSLVSSPLPKATALFFVGCSTQYIEPRIGIAAVKLLTRLGYNVLTPKSQGCCGFAAHVGGDLEMSEFLQGKVVELIKGSNVDFVVTVCPTCNRRIRQVLEDVEYNLSVYDISKFIVEYVEQKNLTRCNRSEMIVTYHESCHLARGLGIKREPRYILRSIFEDNFVEMEDAGVCCGLGGLYGVTHPDISRGILERKIGNIEKTGCGYVFTGCPACLLQLEHGIKNAGMDVKVRHLVELINL